MKRSLIFIAAAVVLAAAVFASSRVFAASDPPSAKAASAALARPCSDVALYGHIKSLTRKGDQFELRFDPAWFLSGVTASRAKLEDTGSSDVPNDNYVVEEGHRLLTYLVPATAESPSSAGRERSPAQGSLDDDHGVPAGSARRRSRTGQAGRTARIRVLDARQGRHRLLPPAAVPPIGPLTVWRSRLRSASNGHRRGLERTLTGGARYVTSTLPPPPVASVWIRTRQTKAARGATASSTGPAAARRVSATPARSGRATRDDPRRASRRGSPAGASPTSRARRRRRRAPTFAEARRRGRPPASTSPNRPATSTGSSSTSCCR